MKVLIADDEPVSRRLLEVTLRRWGYEVTVASDGFEASELLQQPEAPNLAVLDWLMPGIDGVELCREIRQRKKDSYTYILLLTCKRSRKSVIEGLEAGADDYLTKPFDAQELKVRLRTGKRIIYLMQQLVTAREALRSQATRDPLTGIWNRSAIFEILENELARAARQNTPLGLALMDLDHFKMVNDTYGHVMGDQVLCDVVQAIQSVIRPYDAAGRYGGEEFLIVLPGCDEVNAVSHAERVRAAIGRLAIPTPGGERIRFTASFGVAVVGGHFSREPIDLVQAADTALYKAKHGGRDRVELAAQPSVALTA